MRRSYNNRVFSYNIDERLYGVPWYTSATGTYLRELWADRSNLVRVPNWRHICTTGGNASTVPYSYKEYGVHDVKQAEGKLWTYDNHVNTKMDTRISGVYPGVIFREDFSYDVDLYEAAKAKAKARFIKSIRAKQMKMSGPQFLGELRETIRLIRRPASSLFKGIDSYLSGVSKARRGLSPTTSLARRAETLGKVAADLWLEASFGWKPLIADSIGIAETVAEWQVDRRSPVIRGFGGDETTNHGDFGPAFQIATFLQLQGFYVVKQSFGVTYYGRISASAQIPAKGSAQRLLQLSGFTVENFVPTVWELIPFSFVVDYFTNVGELLEAASTDLSHIEWANRASWHFAERYVDTVVAASPSSLPLITATGDEMFGSAVNWTKSFSRQSADDLESYRLSWSMPGTVNRFANLGALLVSKATNFKP